MTTKRDANMSDEEKTDYNKEDYLWKRNRRVSVVLVISVD